MCVCVCADSLPSHVPQVLINREPLRHLNFDVELLGDCDVIVNELCHRLGRHFVQLCSTPLPATEITVDDVTFPVDSGSVETGTENVLDGVGTYSALLSGSSCKAPDLGHAATDSVDDVTLPAVSVTVSERNVLAIPTTSGSVATGTENSPGDAANVNLPTTTVSAVSSKASSNIAQTAIDSTSSPASEIATLSTASVAVSDSSVLTISTHSQSVEIGTENVADSGTEVNLPTTADSVPLFDSSSKVSSNFAQASSDEVDVSLPVVTIPATVSVVGGLVPQAVSKNSAGNFFRSSVPLAEDRADTFERLDAGTASNSVGIDDTHSRNAECSRNVDHHVEESPKTQAFNWASLLKCMHC